MSKYRKKPVVVEAFQMTPARRVDNSDWPEWMHVAWNTERDEEGSLQGVEHGSGDCLLEVVTLEGNHRVSWGDFIIRGIRGELYPCKPDIFAATYEDAAADDRAIPPTAAAVVFEPAGDEMSMKLIAPEGGDLRKPDQTTTLAMHALQYAHDLMKEG